MLFLEKVLLGEHHSHGHDHFDKKHKENETGISIVFLAQKLYYREVVLQCYQFLVYMH